MRDEHGCSRHFGFVNFADEAEAKRAMLDMDHKLINGKPIQVAMAQSKHKRQEMIQSMKNAFQSQSQMQRQGPPLYARASQQLPAPMQPIQQVRITPAPYNQYRSMSVSYPPVGMPSQQMMRYSQQPINYGMGYPNMGAMQMPYGSQMQHRPVQPQQQTYATVARASMQGSNFTTIPPVQHMQMDNRSKDVGVAKIGEDLGALGISGQSEKDTIQTSSMRDALIQPVTDMLKKDERVGFDANGVINLIMKHNSSAKIVSAMKDEKKLTEMIRAVIGKPKSHL